MSNISVKKFYRTTITRYGTVQSFNRTAAYLPNPEDNEMSSSDEEKNSDIEYESTESEYLEDNDEENISDNEKGLQSELQVTSCSDEKETQSDNYRWRKRNPIPVQSSFTGLEFSEPPADEKSPRDYFDMIFDSSLYKKIADEINLYSVQTTGKSVNTSKEEIEQFIGILVQMGVMKYPQYRMYWSPETRLPLIANVMPLQRFENLKRFFHMNDNLKMPKRGEVNFDRLYKVRPLLDCILESCRGIEQEEAHSIDEQIVPTKSKSSLRQYLPNKPHKWGIKIWARCGVSGIVYDFSVYVGQQGNTEISAMFGKIGAVVIQLVDNLPKNVGHKVYMDNLFTSINLFKYLKANGIWAIGTIGGNRLKNAEKLLRSKKELSKEGIGAFDFRIDANSNITVLRWLDNGLVQLLSTFIGPELGAPVKRWSGKEKKMVEVQCPAIINQYNQHMGGVDLCDMLMSLYRIKLGTKKWYMHLVYYCIGLSIVNGWLLYKRHALQYHTEKKHIMSLLDFHSRVALSLLQENKSISKRGRPRSDNTPHVQKKPK